MERLPPLAVYASVLEIEFDRQIETGLLGSFDSALEKKNKQGSERALKKGKSKQSKRSGKKREADASLS